MKSELDNLFIIILLVAFGTPAFVGLLLEVVYFSIHKNSYNLHDNYYANE